MIGRLHSLLGTDVDEATDRETGQRDAEQRAGTERTTVDGVPNDTDEGAAPERPDDGDTAAAGLDGDPHVEYERQRPATQDRDPLRDPKTGHRTVTGPSTIARRANAVRTGTAWTRTLWISEFPDMPVDGLFETLLASAETRRTDVSIHLDPRDTHATLDALENRIEDLEADYEYLAHKRRAGARGVKKDLNDYRDLYDRLRNTPMQAFDVSMYLTTRADTVGELDVTGVRTAARQSPANLTPVTPRWAQLAALTSCSPLAVDRLNERIDTRTPMLAGAVGAMFPFVAGSFAEPGIEYGMYARNGSPLILDRFERETGYCMLVVGKLGAGKSFSTHLQLLRRAMYDGDTTIVMLDPLSGFEPVREALDGEHVTVGGTRGINPLELKPTPREVLTDTPDLDPWAEQITRAVTFFATFFEHVADDPLGGRTQTLRRAIQAAYERQGITRDPATHDNPSPTVRDVITVLEELIDDPDAFGYVTPAEQERVRVDAESLLAELRPSFREGGDLANLAEPTTFDLDAAVLYLDLHQEEGSRGRTETSLMMQVLFNAVYERAKQSDNRVVFVIDEAHYLLNDASSLEFLETAVRHSRHYDLSLQFITQTGGEFALTPEARTIANLCSMTLIHRVDEAADKLSEWFGLSDREVNWVRSATAGNDTDEYAEALLGIDEEGWFPLRVRASPFETRVLTDGWPTDPGPSSKSGGKS